MSNQRFSITPSKAVTDNRLSDSEYRTLAALGMYGDKSGWCFPSRKTLAGDRGVTPATISRHISKLRKLEYLNVFQRKDPKSGAQKSNLVQVRFDHPPDHPRRSPPLIALDDHHNAPYNAPYVNTNVLTADDSSKAVTSASDRNSIPEEKTKIGNEKKAPVIVAKHNDSVNGSEISAKKISNKTGRKRTKRQAVTAELEQFFADETGLPIPKRSTNRQQKAASVLWWGPLYEFYELTGDVARTRELITESVQHMREARLTIASPKSVEKVLLDRYAVGSVSKSVEVW